MVLRVNNGQVVVSILIHSEILSSACSSTILVAHHMVPSGDITGAKTFCRSNNIIHQVRLLPVEVLRI